MDNNRILQEILTEFKRMNKTLSDILSLQRYQLRENKVIEEFNPNGPHIGSSGETYTKTHSEK